MHNEILIAGSGGQGIILLGNIIGKAATLNGMFVTQVSTHGSSQRGTPVQTEIIISDKPIDFAFTQKPDFFIIMSYRGFLEFGRKIVENTKVFIDSDRVIDFDKNYKGKYNSLTASTAAKEIGNPIGANLVMLGKFISVTKIMPLKIIEEAIKEITPEKFIMKSLEALKKGYNL